MHDKSRQFTKALLGYVGADGTLPCLVHLHKLLNFTHSEL